MLALTMPSNTSVVLSLAVSNTVDGLADGATVTGVFRLPDGRVAQPHIVFDGVGGGVYRTTIPAAWTLRRGQPRVGTYRMDVTIVKDNLTLTDRYLIHVAR